MTERIPLPHLYAEVRLRLAAFVLGHPEGWDAPAPATPGWTVHDVVAHLAGVAEDVAGGLRLKAPTEEWTAGHVARGRGVPVPELLARWEASAPAVEALLAERAVWPLVLDAGSHEHDVRGAVGDRGARDSSVVTVGARVLLGSLQVPRPLLVRTPEHGEISVRSGDGAPVTLHTTAFEAFRWRMGRRSRGQLAAMDWSGDPGPYLDSLCVFGPATTDVVE